MQNGLINGLESGLVSGAFCAFTLALRFDFKSMKVSRLFLAHRGGLRLQIASTKMVF